MLRLTPGGNSATSGTCSPSNSMSSPSTPPVRRSSSLSSRRSSITTNNLNSTSFALVLTKVQEWGIVVAVLIILQCLPLYLIIHLEIVHLR